jgi:hypothetical protein
MLAAEGSGPRDASGLIIPWFGSITTGGGVTYVLLESTPGDRDRLLMSVVESVVAVASAVGSVLLLSTSFWPPRLFAGVPDKVSPGSVVPPLSVDKDGLLYELGSIAGGEETVEGCVMLASDCIARNCIIGSLELLLLYID